MDVLASRHAMTPDQASLVARVHQLLGRAQAMAEVVDLMTLLADPLRKAQATLAAVEPAGAHEVMNTLVEELTQALRGVNDRLTAARDEVNTETALVLSEVMALHGGQPGR